MRISLWLIFGLLLASSAQAVNLHDCPNCPEMVVIPAGAFEMGSTLEEQQREAVPRKFADREQPRHTVTIARPFALGKTEVTRGQYAVFARETHRPDPASCMIHDAKTDSWPPTPGYSWHHPGFSQSDNEPAICMTWSDATAYAAWLAHKTGLPYRLPSEAEWEYAARGGTQTTRYWGDAAGQICARAAVMNDATFKALDSPPGMAGKTLCSDGKAFTQPVASFPPNPFGLYDMLGNAWEWVADCGHPNFIGAPTDGSAWMDGACEDRVVKGGAFHSLPWLARSATRGLDVQPRGPNGNNIATGFRVARDLDGSP